MLAQPRVKRLLSSEHFSVDGTLIEAWASTKRFRRKDGGDNDPEGPGRNAERSFHKEKRSNDTHESTSDPEARLYRKADGRPAVLCYMGHALMENRNGLLVGACLTQATGTAEREAALLLLDRHVGAGGRTLAAYKAYDATAFVATCGPARWWRTSPATTTSPRPAGAAEAPSTRQPRGRWATR